MKENIIIHNPKCGCEVEFIGATDYEGGIVRLCLKHAFVLSSDMSAEQVQDQLEKQKKIVVKARATMQVELNRRTVSN